MTPSELAEACAERRRFYEEHGLAGEPRLALAVPRMAFGERMRVMPGVMGVVLSWNGKETNVLVRIRDVEKALSKTEGGKSVRERLGRDKTVPGHPGDPELLR